MTITEILKEIEKLSSTEKLLLINHVRKSLESSEPTLQLKETTETYEKKDIWNELSNSQKSEILEGIEQLDRGERVSYDSILKKIKR